MNTRRTRANGPASRQRGAVLFVSLIFLLVLTLLGVMLARMETTEERIAQNDANHDTAIEAAGAALRFAEMNLSNGTYVNFSQDANGLYQLDPTQLPVDFLTYNWNATGAAITYGGPTLQFVSAPPKIVVVQLPSVAKPGVALGSGGYGSSSSVQVFQITAYATGADQTGRATLQSIYEKD